MKKLYVFSILLVFSVAFACSSKKAVQKEHLTDDILEQNVRLTVRSTTLPESRATLKIASHDLHQLPPAAAFTQHRGQATATVRFLRDTLFVEASCDSLQQLVYEYSSAWAQLRQQRTAESLKSETKQSPLKLAPVLLLLLTLTIIVLSKIKR